MGEVPNLRLVEGEPEEPKTERVLEVVRPHAYTFPVVREVGIFARLGAMQSLPDNVFKRPPDYDQPNEDALAA